MKYRRHDDWDEMILWRCQCGACPYADDRRKRSRWRWDKPSQRWQHDHGKGEGWVDAKRASDIGAVIREGMEGKA